MMKKSTANTVSMVLYGVVSIAVVIYLFVFNPSFRKAALINLLVGVGLLGAGVGIEAMGKDDVEG